MIVWMIIMSWNCWILGIADSLHWGIGMQISFSPRTIYLILYVALVYPKIHKLISLVISESGSGESSSYNNCLKKYIQITFIDLWRNLGQLEIEIRATPSTQHNPCTPCTFQMVGIWNLDIILKFIRFQSDFKRPWVKCFRNCGVTLT